ncbi:MAG: DUF6562 domain-containing protein [Muribaculaceae bacterium]
MKKILSMMLGIIALLTSCSGNENIITDVQGKAGEVTFTLSADNQEQSRADAIRYVMAIYDESEANVVLKATEFSSNTFSLRLEPGKYTCLFWADYGEANYDATDLKNVAAKENSADNASKEAFYAKQGITVTNGNVVNVTLHRAVAQITFKETASLFAGTFSVTYSGYQNFDASTGVASNAVSATEDINIATDVKGSQTSPAEICSIFLLANNVENDLHEFTVKYSTEPEKTISNVPVQANCKTNINGNFGGIPYVTFSADSEQSFSMYIDRGNGAFPFGSEEYIEYSVGSGEWNKITENVYSVSFGGTKGNLRLRGKSSQGTGIDALSTYCSIDFETAGVPVYGKGDIRTLVDYENYTSANTENARFCSLFESNSNLITTPDLPATKLATYCYNRMFYGCSSLTVAPELPANVLPQGCYADMFMNCTSLTKGSELNVTELNNDCIDRMYYGCTKLSVASIVASDIHPSIVEEWLYNAGTEAESRTLTVYNQSVYRVIENSLPAIWRLNAPFTTVIFKN